MLRITPLLWGALHAGVIGLTTWMLVASDLLDSAPILLLR